MSKSLLNQTVVVIGGGSGIGAAVAELACAEGARVVAINAAVDAAGRHLAKELAPRRVNVISPGVIDTSTWGESGSEARLAFLTRVGAALPVQRVGGPVELARAYLFAMTNGFVTGSVVDVDGGGLL